MDKDRIEPFRDILEAMWTDTLDLLAETIERDIAEGSHQ